MKPTASQLTMLHAGESALASASLTVGAGVYQYITSQSLNFPALLAFLGATFLGAMAMIYKSLLANPALPQAESDTANEIKDFVGNEFAQFVNHHFGNLGDRLKGIEDSIANHSHTPASAPSNVVQLPFPPQGTASVPISSLVVTPSAPQPQAPILTTLPTLQAMPK